MQEQGFQGGLGSSLRFTSTRISVTQSPQSIRCLAGPRPPGAIPGLPESSLPAGQLEQHACPLEDSQPQLSGCLTHTTGSWPPQASLRSLLREEISVAGQGHKDPGGPSWRRGMGEWLNVQTSFQPPVNSSSCPSPLPILLRDLCHRAIQKSRSQQASPVYTFTPTGPTPGQRCPRPGPATLPGSCTATPPPPCLPGPATPAHSQLPKIAGA